MGPFDKQHGGCFCRYVRYEVSAAPLVVTVCHCASCRKATGGGMVPWVTLAGGSFLVVAGALALRESSPGVTRGHCARCGTSITYESTARPREIDVTLMSFDDPRAFIPTAHIWVEDKLPWVNMADGIPQFARTMEEKTPATVSSSSGRSAIPATTQESDRSISLRRPANDAEWATYHDIRRRILFEDRGRFGVYDPHHPDEHIAGNFPLLLETTVGNIGVLRVDVRGDIALLRRVAIDTPWQRRGYGRKLLELAEAFARAVGATRVESAVAPDAVPFYEKCGYDRRDGDSADSGNVRMAKTL